MPEHDDPLRLFQQLFERARHVEAADASACALATSDGAGRPSVRMVLLKGADSRGFVFYTSYESRKARELERNPRAGLCFFWPALYEQVRAEGEVERVSAQESDAYFATRPRASQIAARVSRQSALLSSRQELLDRYGREEERLGGGPVARPDSWGGYRLVPARIEFWRGQDSRLHDRVLYVRDGDRWAVQRLQP